MKDFISKTLGGLDRAYFFRHLFFGLCITALMSWGVYSSSNPHNVMNIFCFILMGLLYPYSRFVYESIMNFILGENSFFVNAILLLLTKAITMFICWMFSIFIAPIGMICLYIYHTKNNKLES